jgi:ubiquinone biosynthesis protein UbiJ
MNQSDIVNAAFEAVINSYLRLDPGSLERVAELDGRVVAMELQGLDRQLFLLARGQYLQVLGDYEGEPDTILRGTPLSLLRLGLRRGSEDALFSGDVEIRGDTETGQRFKDLFDSMDIDWEEHLSRLTGDVVAHRLGNLVRQTRRYLGRSSETLTRNLSEYLQEEKRLMPTRIEVENFTTGVTETGLDADRLEARVKRLKDAVAPNTA